MPANDDVVINYSILDDQDFSDRKMDDKIYVFPDFYQDDLKLSIMTEKFKEMVGEDLDETTFDRLLNTMVQESLRANMTGENGADAANAIIYAIAEWLSLSGGEGIVADFDPASDAKAEKLMYNMIMRLMELIHKTVSTRIHIGEDTVGIIAEVPEQISVMRENGDAIIATVMMKTIDLGLPIEPTHDEFRVLMKEFQREIGQYVGQGTAPHDGVAEYTYIGRNKLPNGTFSPWGNPHFMVAKKTVKRDSPHELSDRLLACHTYYMEVIEGLTDRDSDFHWRKVADLYEQSLRCHCAKFLRDPDPTTFCHGHVLAAIAARIVRGAQSAGLPTTP